MCNKFKQKNKEYWVWNHKISMETFCALFFLNCTCTSWNATFERITKLKCLNFHMNVKSNVRFTLIHDNVKLSCSIMHKSHSLRSTVFILCSFFVGFVFYEFARDIDLVSCVMGCDVSFFLLKNSFFLYCQPSNFLRLKLSEHLALTHTTLDYSS